MAEPDVKALLERLEWSATCVGPHIVGDRSSAGNYPACPVCYGIRDDEACPTKLGSAATYHRHLRATFPEQRLGHDEDCELAAAINLISLTPNLTAGEHPAAEAWRTT